MSKRSRSPRLELRLSLSPPRPANSSSADQSVEFSTTSSVSSTYSLEASSCVSSEADEERRAMILLGCLRCLMYVMLSEVDPNPKCPKCKSTVLLDFLNNKENTKKTSS